MEKPNSEIVCALCGATPVFTACLGCGKLTCRPCSHFELIGSGCGCIWPAYYCIACARDPFINANAAPLESESPEL